MIVLDTHAWVWWVSSPALLASNAQRAVENAARDRALYVSSISAWEVALLIKKGRMELTMDVEDWVARSESIPYLSFVPVDNRIAVRSVALPGVFHPDPADRIIVATAQMLGASVVTKDEKIQNYPHVDSLWS